MQRNVRLLTDDRFGFSESAIAATYGAHADQGILRAGCYVPTSREIQTMSPSSLIPLLQNWFWESPSELIPSSEQETAVIALLIQRPDAEVFGSFIREAGEFNQASGGPKPAKQPAP